MNAASIIRTYTESSDDIQQAVRDMLAIALDQSATLDERVMAVHTIAEAVNPDPAPITPAPIPPSAWAMSLCCCRDNSVRHCTGFVSAASQHEANGKALAICKKLYPSRDGWHSHDATAMRWDIAQLIEDPANAKQVG